MFIITQTEESDLLIFCLNNFKNNLSVPDNIQIKILMTGMANNFNLAINKVFGSSYLHLWCAYHSKRAFKKKLLEIVKDPIEKKEIKGNFKDMGKIIDITTFNAKLVQFCKFLNKTNQSFYIISIRYL